MTGDFQGFEVDDGNVVVWRAGHVRPGAVGLHLDPCCPRPILKRFTSRRVLASNGVPRTSIKWTLLSENMPSRRYAAILFDIDGTLVDDDRVVSLALTSFHATYGSELGVSLEDLIARWRALLNLHFARYLAGDVSMQEQRRARVRDLFAPSKPNLSPAAADRVFATYEGHYRDAWSAYPDALPAVAALSGSCSRY